MTVSSHRFRNSVQRYLDLAVRGVRSDEVTGKITRHLERFVGWLAAGLGHDRVSAVTPRKVAAWHDHLAEEGNLGRDGTATAMAPATVNNPVGVRRSTLTADGSCSPSQSITNDLPAPPAASRTNPDACPARSAAGWGPPSCGPHQAAPDMSRKPSASTGTGLSTGSMRRSSPVPPTLSASASPFLYARAELDRCHAGLMTIAGARER